MKKMIAAILKKVGLHRGAPRLYLEGAAPARAGFVPGARFTLEQRDGQQALVLRLSEEGDRTVSRKLKGDRERPVIDLNSAEALAVFAGMESVRVLIGESEIWILPLAVEVKRRARLARLNEELAQGTISTAAIAHGVGVMTNAMHRGLKDAGLKPSLRWAIELEEDALDQAQVVNDAWNADTVAIAMPLQEVGFADDFVRSRLEPVSLLEAGLPCTAASIAGRSKKHLKQAEDDAKAGHLVAGFLALIARANPAVVTLENVGLWFASSSAAILRTQLRELGYDVQEVTVEGKDYAIEARVRTVLVAVTQGVEIDMQSLVAPPRAVQCLGDILEPIAADDACWSEMSYLKDKEVRDAAAGKGFRMAIHTPEDTSCGTVGTGYGKCRSTEIKLQHPENPNLLRQLTPTEHAKIKGIPGVLIEGVESKTRAHELLGQSVIWPAFRNIGQHIGHSLRVHAQVEPVALAA